MKKICQPALLLILNIWFINTYCEPVTVIMDYYPPFSYEENGKIKGVSTLVVKAAFKAAGLKASIKQYPFIRAYKMTQKRTGIFEYCVARTPEREKLFKWVGVVTPAAHGLIALKSRAIQIHSLKDLKKYKIGTVFEDIVDQYLRGKQQQFGFKLDRTSGYDLNMKKLFGKRYDLLGGNLISTMYLAKKTGYPAHEIETVYRFQELTTNYYLVTNPKTSKLLIQKVQSGFHTIQKNGVYQKILNDFQNSLKSSAKKKNKK